MGIINGNDPFLYGEKVKAYKIGDMVVRASLPSTDKYASSWGGFSEYGLVTDAKAMEADGKLYSPGLTQQVVPDGITATQASLMITLKETCSAVNRMNVKKKITL